LNIEY